MKCLGKYVYNGDAKCCYLPVNFNNDIETKHPNYFVKKKCSIHDNCVVSSIRGVPFHANDLNLNVIVFENESIRVDRHPLFFNYEQPPSMQQPPFSSFETVDLMDMVC